MRHIANASSIDTSTSSPSDVAAPDRRQGPDRAEDAGEPLPDLATDEHRCTVGSAAGKPDDPSRPRLQRELGGGLVAPGALEPERA